MVGDSEQEKEVGLEQATTPELLASLGVKIRLDPIEDRSIKYERGGVIDPRDDHFPDKSRGVVMRELSNRVANMSQPDLAMVDGILTDTLSSVRAVGVGVVKDLFALSRKIGAREAVLSLQQNPQPTVNIGK